MARRFNVEDDEFDRLRDVRERGEGRSPVDGSRDVGHVERERVDEVELVPDSVADGELGNVGEGASDRFRDTDDVVFTDGNDLNRVGLFRVGRRVLLIHRNELLGSLRAAGRTLFASVSYRAVHAARSGRRLPNRGNVGQEIRHLDRVLLRRKEKIESVLDFGYRNTVAIGVVLEDELFEVKESTLVVDLLSDLDHRSPGVLRCQSSTFGALSTLNDVFDLEDLLENCRSEDLTESRRRTSCQHFFANNKRNPKGYSPLSESSI